MSSIGKTATHALVEKEGRQGIKHRPGFKARSEQRDEDRKRQVEEFKAKARARREGGK